jgi:1-acyl-sn-glycerol-3-phosphate acyltransferase
MLPSFHWWRTVFFLIPLISVYTIVLGTLSVASTLLGGRGTFAHACARAWSWLILATTGVEVQVRGRERIRPGAACVFASNHQSIYDIPVLFATLPGQVRIIAKDSLGRFPFLGWHLRRSGHLLVNRRHPGALILKRVSALMRQGLSLLVFPEGTRSLDGTVAPFKRGIFVLAVQGGLPIVPVSVSGSRHVMRKGRLTTCPGLVEVVIHDPLETTGMIADDAGELARRVRAVVAAGVAVEPPAAAASERRVGIPHAAP